MRKVYITGASGFVGSNLVPYLAETNEYQIVPVNLRAELPAFDEGSVVIHLAGKAHDLRNVVSVGDYYNVNTKLSQKLFDAFLSSNASVFIFFSSVKAAADKVESALTEEVSPAPATHYGKSKLLAENYMFSKYLCPSRKLYILRPCMIHGPGNKGNLNLLYKFVLSGMPYPLGAFNNKRSLLSIENLCFTISKLMKVDAPSGIYNVADDLALSTGDIVKIMGECLRRNPLVWNISPKLMRCVAIVSGALRLPFNTERLEKLTENYVVDTTKLKDVICQPFPVDAREGLRKTISSFMSK